MEEHMVSMRVSTKDVRMQAPSQRKGSRTPSPTARKPRASITSEDRNLKEAFAASKITYAAPESTDADGSTTPESEVNTPRGHDSCLGMKVTLPPDDVSSNCDLLPATWSGRIPSLATPSMRWCEMQEEEDVVQGAVHQGSPVYGIAQSKVQVKGHGKTESKAQGTPWVKGQSKGTRKGSKGQSHVQAQSLTPGLVGAPLLYPPPPPIFATSSVAPQRTAANSDCAQRRTSEEPEKDSTFTDGNQMCIVSRGSVGHPHHCKEACKFVNKKRGCKDGAACDHCHLCAWNRYRPSPCKSFAA